MRPAQTPTVTKSLFRELFEAIRIVNHKGRYHSLRAEAVGLIVPVDRTTPA